MSAPTRRPTENFAAVIRVMRICSMLVGADISRPDYRMNVVTAITFCSIIGYFIFSVITILGIYKENPLFVLEASCMVGSVLQGVSKLLTGIVYTKRVALLRSELEEIYVQYQKKGAAYCMILNRSCQRSMFIIKLVGFVHFLCVFGIMSVPFIMLLLTGRRYLMMHFLIPYLDISTNFGYFLTLAAHSVCVFMAGFGLFAGDLFVLIFLAHGFLFVDIFKLKVAALNDYTESQFDRKTLRHMLKDIITWHKKYNDFSNNCNDLFYYIITVQVITSGYSIICTLFSILTGDWPGGFTYIFMPIEALYIYCILGTQVEICNDDFIVELYNIRWYNMPPAEQKVVHYMLIKFQNPAEIEIAGFIQLSVNTALRITKTIYSIFMMMLQFLTEA